MNPTQSKKPLRIACDAMCGGLARWLRVLGVDTSFTPDIEDGALIAHALGEQRVVISSDHKLFQRRVFATGELAGVLLPVGLRLRAQLRFVARCLKLSAGFPRCTVCNGQLRPVPRAEVADVVPARSLVWVRDFFRCARCGHVFWEGTHWRRIRAVRDELEVLGGETRPGGRQRGCGPTREQT